MNRSRFLLASSFFAIAASVQAEPYQVVDSQESRIGTLMRTETVIQDGDDPLNRFTITRVVPDIPPAFLRGSLVLLPPLGSNFGFYEFDESGNYLESFAAFFAQRGIDVWGYSPRATGLPADVCAATDCSAMADWGLETQVDDVTFIRDLIEQARPGTEVAVGGFSLGGAATLALIDAHPTDYDAAIVWEGMTYSTDPLTNGYNTPFCEGYEALLAAGVYFDGGSNQGVITAATLAQSDPDGPSPIVPGLTNHQALVFFLSVHQDAPNQPHPDYILAAGDVDLDRFYFADDERLYANIFSAFNAGFANKEVRDLVCGLAGIDTSFADNLGAFSGHVLVISHGTAFGLFTQELGSQMSAADVSEIRYEPFGHVDAMLSPFHRWWVERPIHLFLSVNGI